MPPKKLLIFTQKVDKHDNVLGFMHRWLEEFGKNVERVEVVCLWEGEHDFASERWCTSGTHPNISVHSLGKERGFGKIRQLFRLWSLALRLTPQVDGVFVHMNPIYVLAAGWCFGYYKKPVVLWYVHREVNTVVQIAERLVDRVVSVAKEGFRLPSNKVSFVGHGIDTDAFSPAPALEFGQAPPAAVPAPPGFRVVSVGRISAIKRLEVLLAAMADAKSRIPGLTLRIVGDPVYPDDVAYLNELRARVKQEGLTDVVHFSGSVPYADMPQLYRESSVAVNLAPKGGADKAVLEAMACGIPVLATNTTFADDFGRYAPRLLFAEDDARDLAQKLTALADASDCEALGMFLCAQVRSRHALSLLVPKILAAFPEKK